MRAKDKFILAFLVIIAFGYSLYSIRSILTPFIISLVLAYFLDPLVDNLVRKFKVSRLLAISLIIGVFCALFFAAVIVVLPIIYVQTGQLLSALPHYFSIIVSDIYPKIAANLNAAGIKVDSDVAQILNNEKFTNSVFDILKNFSQNIFTSSVAVVNVLSLIFITPVLIFYLLKDWQLLVKNFHSNLPKKSVATIQKLSNEMDKALSGYVRGQAAVCLILAFLYAALLSFTGLNFGFLIGFLTGIFVFIPYVGAAIGASCAIIFALFQWGFDFVAVAPVVGVFVFGQLLESNFLTPKLIGEKVGLHPVWIIFGLFVFGDLFGFVGILLATPLTAVCGVLVRNFLFEYKKRFT